MDKGIISSLENLHADNFVVYFKSHVFHFDVQGTTFAQDHTLLNEIYDFLWEMHDTLGEQIRQLGAIPCSSMKDMLEYTIIDEAKTGAIPSPSMFSILSTDIQTLMDGAQKLYQTTTDCGGLQTLLGDYIKDLSKLNWKVKATNTKSIK